MMYRKLTVFFAAILMISMSACNKNNPEAVAKQFLNGFYHMDYDKARQVSTEKTIELVNLMEQFAVNYPDSVKQNAKKIGIEIVNIQEEGDNATVTYTVSNEPGEQKLKLVKQNGQWLVSHSKQDNMDEEDYDESLEELPAEAASVTDTASV